MNITVCVKMVSEAHFTDTIIDSTERLKAGRLVMNPADTYALELALRLKETCPGTWLRVLTMGPKIVETIMKYSLAMGADEAIMLCDSRLAGADTLITAEGLAGVLNKLPLQDLILCGQKSIDSETGHIAAQLSALLTIPVITNVIDFSGKKEVSTSDDNVFCLTRIQDNGTAEIRCRGPIIFSVCRGTKMVRIPGIQGIASVQKQMVKQMNMSQAGLEIWKAGKESPTKVISVKDIQRIKRRGGKAESLEDGMDILIKILKKEGGVHP